MKLSCPVRDVREAFSVVGKAVPARTPKPILQSVLMIAGEAGVVLMATDLDVGIRHPIAAPGVVVETAGFGLLPKQITDNILRSADDDLCHIELIADRIHVRVGKARWSVATENPGLFPEPPDYDATATAFVVAPAELVTLVRRTHYAADPDSTQYALGGMLVEWEADRVRLVATNGRQMAMAEAPCDGSGLAKPAGQQVIPARFAQLVASAAKDESGLVEVAFPRSGVVIRSGGTVYSSRLVQGRFPAWRVLFDECPAPIAIPDVDSEAFSRAVEQVAVMVTETTRGVDFRFSAGGLVMATDGWEIGHSEVDFPLPGYEGADHSARLDPRYLIPALKALVPFPIEMRTDGDGRSLWFLADGFTHIAMGLSKEKR